MVKDGLYVVSRQRVGLAFAVGIYEPSDSVFVAILGAGTIAAATADDGYQVHQAKHGVDAVIE